MNVRARAAELALRAVPFSPDLRAEAANSGGVGLPVPLDWREEESWRLGPSAPVSPV
jgi:hypothetical protein